VSVAGPVAEEERACIEEAQGEGDEGLHPHPSCRECAGAQKEGMTGIRTHAKRQEFREPAGHGSNQQR